MIRPYICLPSSEFLSIAIYLEVINAVLKICMYYIVESSIVISVRGLKLPIPTLFISISKPFVVV